MFNDVGCPRGVLQVVGELAIAVPFERVGQIQPGVLFTEAHSGILVNLLSHDLSYGNALNSFDPLHIIG